MGFVAVFLKSLGLFGPGKSPHPCEGTGAAGACAAGELAQPNNRCADNEQCSDPADGIFILVDVHIDILTNVYVFNERTSRRICAFSAFSEENLSSLRILFTKTNLRVSPYKLPENLGI